MTVRTLIGDCRAVLPTLPAQSVHCIVTSPPYFGLRDYSVAGQIGLEQTPDAYVAEMVAVFRECRRVLRDDGTIWLNLGDSYNSNPRGTTARGLNDGRLLPEHLNGRAPGLGKVKTTDCKPKDLLGIPWRVAFALQADGWYLRQDIIWAKPNPMPESVRDRCTKAHEYIFLLSKRERYFYDAEAIAEALSTEPHAPGNLKLDASRNDHASMQKIWGLNGTRNRRSVWTVATEPYSEAHFATFPPALIEPCIKAGCPVGGTVLDPFGGAGTTGLVADRLQRNATLIELNPACLCRHGRSARRGRSRAAAGNHGE